MIISHDEWEEWRVLEATKVLIKRVEEFRNQTFIGLLSVNRERRDEVVDCVIGMDLIIEIVKNIHKEGVA